MSRNPNVFWAQTESKVSLKIDLKDVKNADINFMQNEVTYMSKGIGTGEHSDYGFSLKLFDKIDTEKSSFKINATRVDVSLVKSTSIWWPRLTNQPQKPHFLKIDFDKWRPSKEDEDAFADEADNNRNIMDDYPDIMGKLENEELGYRRENLKKVYLMIYNLVQFVGYFYVLLVMCVQYGKSGANFIPHTYQHVGSAMKFFQLLQFLEVMHPIFGYTRNSAMIPFMQTTGRAFILFIMIELEPRMQNKPLVFYLFFVWSLIEVVRYPYYFLNLILDGQGKLKFYFQWIQWLRYTIWIPLYPLGVLCEGLIIIRNIVYFEETKKFTLEMPNKFNFTFNMVLFLKTYLLFLILPGIFFMMKHMAKERVKKLKGKYQA